jgi:serine/threonine protein kinase
MQHPTRIGKYEILEVIGRGGMGVVYKALDPALNRVVAVKMVTVGLADDPALTQRFYREARATASLRHPNIVTVYDLGEHEGNLYLVMEYIDGVSLDAAALSPRQLSITERIKIIIDVCHGLEYAHERGVVHRDIKPGNVMIPKEGDAKIVDFGIAHIGNDGITRTGEIVGSLKYMSPEQIKGGEADPRSDIFSTGVVLYQLVTGSLPFEAKEPASALFKILNDAPLPFEQFLSTYPDELEAVTTKALAKVPEDRYASAADFAKALLGLLDNPLLYERDTKSREPSTIARGTDSSTRPFPAAGVATGMLPAGTVGKDVSPPKIAAQPVPPVGEWTEFFEDAVPTRLLESDAAAATIKGPPSMEEGDFTRLLRPGPSSTENKQSLPPVRLTFTVSNDGLRVGQSVPLASVPFRIGRNADLSIGDKHLSREHVLIDWDGKSFRITDLGSKNGTYVNGRRLRAGPQVLPFGAVIRLGTATVLTFSADDVHELPDLTGQLIADRYRLTKVLRNGSKTALYEASDSHLPQLVAIKILSPSLAAYSGYLEHFNREAETAVHLRHPHICKVLDYGQASIRLAATRSVSVNYLSMELMEGGSLSDRLEDDAPVELSQVIYWLNHVTNALDAAHRRGVTHGGLKPSSIVFDRDGEPYVADFAMSYRVNDQAKAVFLGSPEFLAPEQWDGAALTPLADQYSLAVVTYLLLAGSLPFEGQLDPRVRERNFLRGPVRAHEEAARVGRPPLPAKVSSVLERGLEVRPEDRYASVREFFLDLEHAVSNQSKRPDGKPKVFISYQRDPSSGWAVHFATELERRYQISAFVDTQRLDSAVRFPARLKSAIQDCDVFVCLLSGSTLQSKWVQEEIRLAWENNKLMIPVFQESYCQPDSSERLEPHVETLINYDGLQLLDRRNLYVDHTIEELAKMVTASAQKLRDNK